MVRPFVGSARDGRDDAPLAEIAIDVRRAGAIDRATLRSRDRRPALQGARAHARRPRVHPPRGLGAPEQERDRGRSTAATGAISGAWDETFEKDYAAALPGGVSDGTNPEFWADRIDAFMATLNRLEEWSELPDEIHVLELGVGDGQGAKVWLDCLRGRVRGAGPRLPRPRALPDGRLLAPRAGTRARSASASTPTSCEGLELDFRNPMSALSDLRGKLLFAHTCNVYDNLPTDEVMRVGDHAYEPLVRASITPTEMADLVGPARHRAGRDRRRGPARAARGTRVHRRRSPPACSSGPTCGRPSTSRRSTSRSRPRRRCAWRPAPTSTSTSCVDELPEWTRVHMSTVAAESFAQTLQLLHYEGILVAQDLFAGDVGQYASYPWTWQARGLDRQLDQRADLPAHRRAQRLRGDRRALRLPRRLEHLGPERPPPRRLPTPEQPPRRPRARHRGARCWLRRCRRVASSSPRSSARRATPTPSSSGRAPARSPARSTRSTSPTTRRRRSSSPPSPARRCSIDEGVDPILQITGRDRNVMALQSELLGAWALGVRTVLALTGDPLKVGPYEGIATRVGDLDSLGLTRLIATMNEGRLAAGEPLEQPTSFLIAGAANPLVDSVERLEGKLEAGVGLLQTQHRLRRRALRRLAGALRRGRHHRARAAARRHRAAAQQPDADLHARAHPGRRGRRRDVRPHGGPHRRRRHRDRHRDRRRAGPARARGAGRQRRAPHGARGGRASRCRRWSGPRGSAQPPSADRASTRRTSSRDA